VVSHGRFVVQISHGQEEGGREQRRVFLLRLSLETVLIRRATNSLALFVSVEDNFTLILNKLAVIVALPKSIERITIIVCVVLANERLEVLRGLFTVIEWHLREEVVDDVIVCDVVEEETTLPPKERSVDSARCTTLEAPFTLAVVRKALVGVMKVGDHNEPMGDAEPWEGVVLDDLTSSPDGRSVGDSPNHSENAEVGGNDGVTLRRVEKHRVGIEMVGPLGVRLLTGDVEKKVSGEGKDLLADEHEESVNRGVPDVMLPIDILVLALWDTKVRAGLGDVHFILLHRSMVGMVAMVRDAPREEGSPHEGVGDEAYDVAYSAVGRESTVTGLVANDPDAGEVETLEPPVDAPETPPESLSAEGSESVTNWLGGSEGINISCHPPEDSGDDEVASRVHQTTTGLADEETCRYSCADFA